VLELVRGGVLPQAGTTVRALFNLGDGAQPISQATPTADEALLFSSEAARYGGRRHGDESVSELLPSECVVFGPAAWALY
jgi:hypothetical protein